MCSQVVQVCGALLVLMAYVLAQAGVWSPVSFRYLLPNLLGSTVLTANALSAKQWGFVLLEGAWALISAWSIIEKLRGVEPSQAAH